MSLIELKVPAVGESVQEVTLSTWLKENGSYVELDEVICEFESDKATLEGRAEQAGILSWAAQEGDDIQIGGIFAKIDTAVAKVESSRPVQEIPLQNSKETITSPIKTGEVIEIIAESPGESVPEGSVGDLVWLKENGDSVEMDEVIGEIETEKATMDIRSPKNGRLVIIQEAGDELQLVGKVIAKIEVVSTQQTTTAESNSQTTSQEESSNYAKGYPSPAAKKLMEEHKIKATDIQGTGKNQRITKADVQQAISNKANVQEQAKQEKATAPKQAKETKKPTISSPAPSTTFSRTKRQEKMSRMRRTIARRLVSAKNNTAMLTTFNEVDLSNIQKLRKTYQDRFVERYGIKLGYMSLFAKACSKVLLEMPGVNAQLSEDGKSLIYHDYADISIAISTPTGLVVPPVHNVESLSFSEVEYKIKALAKKARDGKLTLQEMQGGTFTITNGGVFGSMMSTPILNEPQSAILGMHTIQQRPIAVNGEVQIRPMMYLALSYDHRVIDGSSSVTFLVKVKKLLEDPTTLLLDI